MLTILGIGRTHDMIKTDCFLSASGFSFNGQTDIGRDELELNLQSRYQGLKPNGVDYLIQARPDAWLVNGMSVLGARAVASVARGMRFIPNRLDITFEKVSSGSDGLEFYCVAAEILKQWFMKKKPTTTIFEATGLDHLRKIIFGTRTSRFTLVVQELDNGTIAGYRITWQLREPKKVQPAWDYLDFFARGEEYEHCCQQAFAACTNSLLGPDFFGLGHSTDVFLMKDKTDDKLQDWWGFLAAVSKKIVHQAELEGSQHLAIESVEFIQAEISKSIERKAKEQNELAVRGRQIAESVLLSK